MNGTSIQGNSETNQINELVQGFFREDYVSKMMDTMFIAKNIIIINVTLKDFFNFLLFKKNISQLL